jgi:carbon storage regulator
VVNKPPKPEIPPKTPKLARAFLDLIRYFPWDLTPEAGSVPVSNDEEAAMVVLGRRVGEQIRIGENVVIKVLSVNGRSVRLGIEAPYTVSIWRLERLPNSAGLKYQRPGEKTLDSQPSQQLHDTWLLPGPAETTLHSSS